MITASMPSPITVPNAVPRASADFRGTLAFFLFLLVNATLFIRPGEIVSSMEGWEVYFYCIVICLIVASRTCCAT